MTKRLALVTGASSGIGAATAKALARRGWRVVLVARNEKTLDALRTEIAEQGGEAVVEAVDASYGVAVLAMASRVLDQYGVPDVLVHSAGAGAWKFIEETAPEEAAKMMNAPYFAAFNVTHAFMKPMLERGNGQIVHVQSPASRMAIAGATGYVAGRWALRGLHEALCQDLAGTGVRSTQVVFGKVSSEYFERNAGAKEHMPGIAKTIRTITPEECAQVILRAIDRPRREVVYPFMLRLYYWTDAIAPWLPRWLIRRSGPQH